MVWWLTGLMSNCMDVDWTDVRLYGYRLVSDCMDTDWTDVRLHGYRLD